MKVALVVALLTALTFAGCISTGDNEDFSEPKQPELNYNPDDVRISGTASETVTIESFDGTSLSTIIYAPLTQDALPDGNEPPFPVVVFLHGWGFPKETWENHQDSFTSAPYSILEEFAQQGFITVAYDARGWGQSGGQSTAGHTNELLDFDSVLNYVESNYKTNGYVGVTGISYGGGQAMMLLAKNERVDTVVSHQGWVDLYEGLVPGNVPKLEWAEFLYIVGIAGTGIQLDPIVHEWYQATITREDTEGVRAAMDQRSVEQFIPEIRKPLFLCQGLQESLFPQSHQMWDIPGFVRAHYFAGGHNIRDAECFDKTLTWFQYFLLGKDNGVDKWPAVTTVDAGEDGFVAFEDFPEPVEQTWYLRAPKFAEFPSRTEFTIQQMLVANPFDEPSGLYDLTDMPRNAIPEQLRQDPTATTFTLDAGTETQVLAGAPKLYLNLTSTDAAFQVAGAIYHISEGNSRLLGTGAYAAVEDHQRENIVLDFPWIKAEMAPGDQIQLKLASNNPSIYMPLLGNYEVTFNGQSHLVLPFLP